MQGLIEYIQEKYSNEARTKLKNEEKEKTRNPLLNVIIDLVLTWYIREYVIFLGLACMAHLFFLMWNYVFKPEI